MNDFLFIEANVFSHYVNENVYVGRMTDGWIVVETMVRFKGVLQHSP